MLALMLAGSLLAAAPAAAGPAPIGYAQATGYYKKDSRPTLYQPLNVLDAREITSWCTTSADYLSDTLMVGFKSLAKIDEIRIYTGNGFDEQTFKDFGRPRQIVVRAGKDRRKLTLEDHRGLQAFPLTPPMETSDLAIEVLDVYPAEEDPDSPACITDVVFFSGGRALNGAWLTQKIKYDRERSALLGTWYGGYDGSPDRYLSFFYDDTYRLSYEPYEQDNKRKTYGGTYDATASRLTLEIPGKGRVSARVKRETRNDDKGTPVTTLNFEGGLPDDWKLAYRNRR